MAGQYSADSGAHNERKKEIEIFQLVAIHMPLTRMSSAVIHTHIPTCEKEMPLKGEREQ